KGDLGRSDRTGRGSAVKTERGFDSPKPPALKLDPSFDAANNRGRHDAGKLRPPRLLVKTLTVTFTMVAALLVIVFVVVYFLMRDQVRRSVTENLESSQRLFAAMQTRRERELRDQAANIAENPTLKAALDTYAAESKTSDDGGRAQLVATISNELHK